MSGRRTLVVLGLALAAVLSACRSNRPSAEAAAGPLADLLAAARAGDAARLRQLVAQDPGLVHATFSGTSDGPVAAAAAAGKVEALAVLAEAGAELRERDLYGRTPLHRAADPAVASFLLERGLQPDIRSRDGETPLMSQSANLAVLEVLLRAGARPNLRQAEGKTALHALANTVTNSPVASAALLCSYGADPAVADEAGETARAAARRPGGGNAGAALADFLAEGGGCDVLRAKTRGRGGVSADELTAVSHELSCRQGDAWACGRLGYAHETGAGVAKDLVAAARFYEQSCNGKHAWGCYALAYSYDRGEGVKKDVAKALALFETGCAADYLPSCGQVAYHLEKGNGTPRDDARAAALYTRACDGKEAWACWRLGDAYAAGRGVVRDDTRAAELRSLACKGGEARACAPKPR